MKNILLGLTILLLSTMAVAESGFYHNPERDGEGVSVVIDGDTLAFAFFTYWDAKHAIPPIVSPPPPVLKPIIPCHNCPVWYVGTGVWVDGASIGDMYMSSPIEYPLAVDGNLDVQFVVGQYLIVATATGYDLIVNCNSVVPASMYMCNTTFTFNQLLIGD